MTTESLRKVIRVTHWMIGEKGIAISYDREDLKPIQRHLVLTPLESVKALSIIGSIEQRPANDLMAMIQIKSSNFQELSSWYKLCQWEALNIVIRHEYENELEKDLGIINIENAINKIIT